MFWGHVSRLCSLTNPLRIPSLISSNASSRRNISTLSHSVLPCLGSLGGERSKSPGFFLCSGFPPYLTFFPHLSRSSGLGRSRRMRRLGLKLVLGLIINKRIPNRLLRATWQDVDPPLESPALPARVCASGGIHAKSVLSFLISRSCRTGDCVRLMQARCAGQRDLDPRFREKLVFGQIFRSRGYSHCFHTRGGHRAGGSQGSGELH